MEDTPPAGGKPVELVRVAITLPNGNAINLTIPDNDILKALGAAMLAAMELYVHGAGLKKPQQSNLLVPHGPLPRLRN